MSGRLPFNPDHMRAKSGATPKPPSRSDGETPWSVSTLAARIGRALETGLPASVRVVGEVSGGRERTHWYFDLKDAGAVVSCVLFASAARRAGAVTPEDGRTYVARGRVEFYAPGGKTSFIVERLEPVGVGELELAFRRLCDELRALGWFDEARKRPIPACPRRVAVVTSRSGAALQDVLDTARRRFPGVAWGLYDSPVQGEGAAERIAGAIDDIGACAQAMGVDAILLTRGGGSMQDLWAFNERVVAEAIVRSPIPVVAAIGHETDVTIAELVADLRCATPTQAAMRLTPDRAALLEEWSSLARRLDRAGRREVSSARERLDRARTRPAMADPGRLVAAGRERMAALSARLVAGVRAEMQSMWRRVERAEARLQRASRVRAGGAEGRLGGAAARLEGAMRRRLELARSRTSASGLETTMRRALRRRGDAVAAASRELDAIGPVATLRRGFTITLGGDGKPIRSVEDVRAGSTITTQFEDGAVRSRVARDRAGGGEPPQMDLFGSGG